MYKIDEIINNISDLCPEAMEKARLRQNRLTKPIGSLGILEELSVKIAGITGNPRPRLSNKTIFVFAGDHGVVDEKVSAYPKEVTAQMVYNFLHRGAAINVLAGHINAKVVVVDTGVAADLEQHPALVIKKMGYGTGNIARVCAMTANQARESIMTGISMIETQMKSGLDIAGLGEMGIGNTTPSAAIASVITGLPAEKLTGRGTGIDDTGREHKIGIIKKAVRLHKPDPGNGLEILRKIGGFEIGAIAGAVLGAASYGIPVVIDGFISTAGALIAHTLCPKVSHYILASHVSAETGHIAMLSHLKAVPLLDLKMRLGEGTGAALAINIAEAACKLLDEMATFEQAGVTDIK